MGNYNTYSGTSIAQQLLGNSWLGRLLYGKPETYKDGYGTERQHTSLSESANGQELQRMGDTAKTAGKIALTGFAFTNPFTASSTASSMLGTLGQSYFLGEGLKDAKYRIQNGSTVGDGVMLGLDLLPATSVAKTVFNGAKNIGPALKQIVKNAEYADYMGRLNDASKYNTGPTITNVTGTSDVIKSKPYARIAPSDGRINSAVNYNLRYDPKNFVQVISDTEPGYYSVHFKTEKGSPTSNNIQQVVDQIVSDLPGGSRLATWGTVSKGGFSGLDRFAKAGMIKTGEYRPLTFKDQSVANEVAEKYGLTLNADGTINWPVLKKSTIRLYRAQPVNPTFNPTKAANGEAQREFAGQWFTPDIRKVDWYAHNASAGGAPAELQYVDILEGALPKYAANKLVPKTFDFEPEDYIIPNTIERVTIPYNNTTRISVFGDSSKKLLLKNGGKIHIKEKNKGKFTKAAKAAGESVQEHAHNVINDSNATTLQKKRAQFAINAKKWHK